MGFVEILSLAVLIIAGLAGLLQSILALAGRETVPAGQGSRVRFLRIAVFLLGGLVALAVAGLWLADL